MTRRHTFRKKEQGIAVISAILIAALVASLAFALFARERLWLNQMANRQDLAAAQSVALSAIDLARLTLRDDMRSTSYDHLLEPWTVPVPPIKVDDGQAGGRLSELQGRFNLFSLQNSGQVSPNGVLALQRLLATRNLPTNWADKVARVMVSQVALIEQQSSGALRGQLLAVANVAELADLTGIEAGQLAALSTLVTVLPQTTAVNVNFASPEVLMALTPGLALGDAERIVSRRAATPFKTVQEFTNALPEHLRSGAVASLYGVESQYFLAESEAAFGRAQVRLQALVYRRKNLMPELLWVRRL